MTKHSGNRKACYAPGLLLGLLGLTAWSASAVRAQEPEPIAPPVVNAPAAVVSPYSLEHCIQHGLANQPAMKAAYAGLASAQTAQQALLNLKLVGLISREVPIRRKQASLGVVIANAEVSKVEGETIYAITRTYFSVIYAKKQTALLKDVSEFLAQKEDEARTVFGADPTKVTEADLLKLKIYRDLLKTKQFEAAAGTERALAALREAMGLEGCAPLFIVEMDLPSLENNLCKEQLIELALARRGSMIQASTAADVVCLEVSAQKVIPGTTGRTFAAGADIHATPIPQGNNNGDYRPWAIGIEMPTTLVGHCWDRVRRAEELCAKALAVVEKTRQLITLETADAFHKWQESAQTVKLLDKTVKDTAELLNKANKQFKLKPETAENLITASVLDAQVQAKYNEALYHHALGLAALERITGGGFMPCYRAKVVAVPQQPQQLEQPPQPQQ